MHWEVTLYQLQFLSSLHMNRFNHHNYSMKWVPFRPRCGQEETQAWGMGLILLKIFPFAGDSSQLSFSPRTLSPSLFSPLPSVIRERNFSFYLCSSFHWGSESLSSVPHKTFTSWILIHSILSPGPHIYMVSFLPIQKFTRPLKIGKCLILLLLKNLPICAHSFLCQIILKSYMHLVCN